MSKKQSKRKKGFIRPVHLQALVFVILYTIVSKTIFVKAVTSANTGVAFLVPYIFGVVAGVILLYLFSHEDFFHFMKEVERGEQSQEEDYLRNYKHYGKIASTLIIAALGGPVFAALTIRFLLNKFWYKYLLLAAGNVASTFITVSIARGAINLILKV